MFKVVLIGRPNVGKSTLFNYLLGKKIALCDATPGLTRDRREHKTKLFGMNLSLIDTGGYENDDIIMNQKIWEQGQKAIDEATLILFILDGTAGISPADKELANILRKSQKPVIACINKTDTKEGKRNAPLFFELGFENIIHISSVHAQGMGDLYHSIKPYYDEYITTHKITKNNDEEVGKPEFSLAFIGKPNVGKSTIVNTILHEDRLITNDESGTTRDSIYIDLTYQNEQLRIVDTAGLRRRANVQWHIEKMANAESIHAINFSMVTALVISAEEGLSKQDLTLAKLIVDEGRALMVIVNKIDLIKNKKQFLQNISGQIEDAFFQIKKPYVVGISALKDKDITNILDIAKELYQKWQFKISTSKLNIWLEAKVLENNPPLIKARRLKVKFARLAKTRPPTVHIWSNFDKEFPQSYLRYLRNCFYEAFNLWGCTVRFEIKKSDNPYKDKPRESKREKQVKENIAKRASRK